MPSRPLIFRRATKHRDELSLKMAAAFRTAQDCARLAPPAATACSSVTYRVRGLIPGRILHANLRPPAAGRISRADLHRGLGRISTVPLPCAAVDVGPYDEQKSTRRARARADRVHALVRRGRDGQLVSLL